MKKIFLSALAVTAGMVCFAQTGSNVKTNGNVLNPGDKIGSTNDEDVTIMTNGQNHTIFKKNGNLRLVSFDNARDGIVLSNANGVFTKTNFTGNNNDVLNGLGVFAPLNTITGWTLTGAKIHTSKRVGINISNPLRDFEVAGDAVISGTLYVGNIESIDVVNAKKRLEFKTSMFMTGYDAADGSRNELWVHAGDFYINGKTSMDYNTIINSGNNGKVGIGTSTPLAKLHVDGSFMASEISLPGAKMTYEPPTGGSPAKIKWTPVTGPVLDENLPPCLFPDVPLINAVNGLFHSYGASTVGGYTNTMTMGFDGSNGIVDVAGRNDDPAAPKLLLNYYCGKDVAVCTGYNGGSVYMCNESMGGVGIATSYIPDGFKLAVKGKVIAEDIRVRLRATWPDYVFSSTYTITPLSQIEKYISENHRLPGIPSAETLEKEGIDTGEMMRLQMEKIEELTLHIISLEKRIKELEEK